MVSSMLRGLYRDSVLPGKYYNEPDVPTDKTNSFQVNPRAMLSAGSLGLRVPLLSQT